MYKANKCRLYPTVAQARLLDAHFGCSRLVYNVALATKKAAWESNSKVSLSAYDLIKQLPDFKQEYPWLKEVSNQALQQSILDMEKAYTNFFRSGRGFPKFKSKSRSRKSFRTLDKIEVSKGKLSIINFRKDNKIKIKLSQPLVGKIKNATISKTPTGKYYASLLCDTGIEAPTKKEVEAKTTVGIDLGIKSLIVTSKGQEIGNPRYLKKAISRIKFTSRKYSKYKGKRTKKKLALLHEKVANKRKDNWHKITSQLISENQTIAIEDLNVAGMVQNHNLALHISDAGWGMAKEMLKYKAEWHGKNLLQIGRFQPSSKTCSNCGHVYKELTLKEREWTCSGCNSHHDRDANAATNIKNFALEKHFSGTERENQEELSPVGEAETPEAQK